MLDILMPIVQTGAVGGMLLLSWKYMTKKDKDTTMLLQAQNEERKEMYRAHTELVKEVTAALNDKNHTDNAMSLALEKLTRELSHLREKLQ